MASPESLLERARDLHLKGDTARALPLYRQGLAGRPKEAAAWFLYGLALQEESLAPAAAEALRRAVSLMPADERARHALAAAERRLGRMDAALEVWKQWRTADPRNPAPLRALISDLISLHKIEDALGEARRALQLFPDDPPLLLSLARLAERAGLAEESRGAAERLLAQSPADIQARLILARLDAAAGVDTLAQLESIAAAAPDSEAAGLACLELGAALDRAGSDDRAFDAIARGKRLLFERLPPDQRDRSRLPRFYEACRAGTSAQRTASWPAPPPLPPHQRAPIFLVGFPRTGTTLLEQILAAHPRLLPTDELPLLQPARDLLHQEFAPRNVAFPGWLGQLTPRHIQRARDAYFARVAWHLGDTLQGRRLVDKQPLNTADLCTVRRIFPDSPVIVALRDPRDTCLSCFFHPLRHVPAFFDLRATAELYASLMGLWLHYKSCLGLRALELRYEDLTADPEARSREIFAHIGEPWDDAALRFFEPRHRRFIATPSYRDVSRPVYKTSVARWRRYERHVREIEPILRPFIRAFGYE